MKKKDFAIYALLFLTGILSRIPFLEKFQSHWDGPQYTIALINYSFAQQTPAPPGYPLYIGLGKFFHLFIHDPHAAILAVSVFGGVVGAIILYFIGLKMYHRLVGIAAASIFLTGSTFYYFSISPHAYNLVVSITVLLAYIVYRVFVKKKQEGLLLGLIFGVFFGIRPQEIMQIGILFLFGFFALSTKEKVKASIMFVTVTLSWFIPVVQTVGFTDYFVQSNDIAKTALLSHSITERAWMILKGFLLSFGIAGGSLVYYITKQKQIKNLLSKHKRALIFYLAWIAPGFLYNLLMRSDTPGYQMSYLTALLLLISYAIWQSTRKNRLLYIAALTCIVVFNLYWFFYDRDPAFTKPYRTVSFHYSELRKNDIKFGSKVRFIQEYFHPQTTLVITSTDYWRQYMYYLKNYQIFSPSGLTTKEKRFQHKEYYAFDWVMKETQNKYLRVVIPGHIKTIVFTDDDSYSWIDEYQFKKIALPGRSNIVVLMIPPEAYLQYNYHQVKIIVK